MSSTDLKKQKNWKIPTNVKTRKRIEKKLINQDNPVKLSNKKRKAKSKKISH